MRGSVPAQRGLLRPAGEASHKASAQGAQGTSPRRQGEVCRRAVLGRGEATGVRGRLPPATLHAAPARLTQVGGL